MAIEFVNAGDYVLFDPTLIDNLTTMSIGFRAKNDTYGGSGGWGSYLFRMDAFGGANGAFAIFNYGTAPEDIRFSYGFDTQWGWWRVADAFVLGTWFDFMVTYDNTNVANDPIFYIKGIAQATIEDQVPIGSVYDDSTQRLLIGNALFDTSLYFDGPIGPPRIFNRILTPQEVYTWSKSRDNNIITNGLVFAPDLNGASGLGMTLFDGAALGATNLIHDPIGNIYGTPAGSPIGRGNVISNYGEGVQ